jgi:hypothetical protein
LKDDNLSDEKRKDLMLFLKEFCVFSQTLQQQNRDNFFQVNIDFHPELFTKRSSDLDLYLITEEVIREKSR